MAVIRRAPRRRERPEGLEPTPPRDSVRVLTASAHRIDLRDRKEARLTRSLKQGWQEDAWAFRDAIGELRYAASFLANCAARMRLLPAVYMPGGSSDVPVPLAEAEDGSIPAGLQARCEASLAAIGNGRMALAPLMKALSTSWTIAGECFLLGREDPETMRETWTIRSVDEVIIQEDKLALRELPLDPQGQKPYEILDPELTTIARMWAPHPRFRMLADSPVRAIIDDCESLMILRRAIRASGRSRLAGRGILLIPDGLSITSQTDENEDPEADPFFGQLAAALTAPIADEGVASAVTPVVVRGPGDALAQVRHLDFASSLDAMSGQTRAELVGIIASGLDLPKEVIMGVADLNHWSAWQVEDNTFRHHIEPHVIELVDALTAAYLRPTLEAEGVDPEWVNRLVIWYDPTELVTHPDQTADALQLHDRMVISDDALLRIAGFQEEDAPSDTEFLVRIIHNMRQWPPNVVMAAIHQLLPNLTIPAITTAGTIPGVKPTGVDVGEIPPPAGTTTAPALPPRTDTQPAPPVDSTPAPAPHAPEKAPPDAQPAEAKAEGGLTAAGEPEVQELRRMSEQLAAVDRELRVRLQVAANGAVMRELERAGAKLRTRVAKDETLRVQIDQRPNERVPAYLGKAVVASLGVSSADLINSDWGPLRSQFYEWTLSAQKQAVRIVGRHLDVDEALASTAEAGLKSRLDGAWNLFASKLTSLAHSFLYEPNPNVNMTDWGTQNPNTLVPMGLIRQAISVAGGGRETVEDGRKGQTAEPLGQIGNGSVVSDLIEAHGGEAEDYEWLHGPSLDPFEPHEELDHLKFGSFSDERLRNHGTFPDNEYYVPGDHQGCSCDWMPLWVKRSATSPTIA